MPLSILETSHIRVTCDACRTASAELCPNADYPSAFLATMDATTAMAPHPKLAGWAKTSRLNPIGAIAAHREDPRVIASRDRIKRFGSLAAMNLRKLISASG